MTGPDNVPAYVLAKDEAMAAKLLRNLREQGVIPELLPKELPLLDHMALFYQEGGKLDTTLLSDRDAFASSYATAIARNPEFLDPLRLLRGPEKTP